MTSSVKNNVKDPVVIPFCFLLELTMLSLLSNGGANVDSFTCFQPMKKIKYLEESRMHDTVEDS